jgi:hypothetical protein
METSQLKTCTKCKEELPLERFNKRSQDTNKYQSWCRSCKTNLESRWYHMSEDNKRRRNKQVLERIRNNKKKAVEYLGGKCYDCGGVFHPAVYDFHHKNPNEKEEAPTDVLHKSWDKILLEIDKCELLCSNCHRLRHHGEVEL